MIQAPKRGTYLEIQNVWQLLILADDTEMVQITPLRRTLASSPLSECTSCHQQGQAGSKTLLKQNPLVLNRGCWLTQVVLYNGHKMVVVVVVIVVVVVAAAAVHADDGVIYSHPV